MSRMDYVDWQEASDTLNSLDENGPFVVRVRPVDPKTCKMCDDTGYKDHAGFCMDPCDHGQSTSE